MALSPSDREFFGWQWRTVVRPAILRRAGGSFDDAGNYLGLARCERCGVPDVLLSVWEPRSHMEIGHLDGNRRDSAPENLACLCHACHRAHDYRVWSLLYRTWLERERERRIDEADAARPLLRYLEAAS